MTLFVLSAALLLAVGLSFLLWPLLRGGGASTGRDRAIISLYRDQLRELDSDRAAGTVRDDQYEAGRRDLERRLLQEIAQAAPVSTMTRGRGWTAAAITVLVVALPIGLYLVLGSPDAIGPRAPEEQAAAGQGEAGASENAPHAITPEQVQAMIDELVKRLQQNPDDGEGWAMVARSYSYLRKFPEAVKAYEKASTLLPNDAHLLADYADALAMTQGRSLTGAPMKLVQRALTINPGEVKALALAGSEAFDRKDYSAAIGYWDRAIKAGPSDPQFAEQLHAGIEEAGRLGGKPAISMARADAGPVAPETMASAPASADSAIVAKSTPAAGASVKGRIELSPALASRASPTDTLFVFARAAQGPRMPLALMKRQVRDLPLEFALDDSMAMMPSLKLSNFSSVVIGARVSKAGDAMPASGDLQGFSQPVKVGTAGIDVRIDQVVP